MTRLLRHYHMGCGETLSSSCWLMLAQQMPPTKTRPNGKSLMLRTNRKKKT